MEKKSKGLTIFLAFVVYAYLSSLFKGSKLIENAFVILFFITTLVIIFLPRASITVKVMRFRSPINKDYSEEVSNFCWLWVLLFAPIYFAVKGNWRHALISFLLFWTIVSWFIYPFYAKTIMRNHYLRNGWKEIK